MYSLHVIIQYLMHSDDCRTPVMIKSATLDADLIQKVLGDKFIVRRCDSVSEAHAAIDEWEHVGLDKIMVIIYNYPSSNVAGFNWFEVEDVA